MLLVLAGLLIVALLVLLPLSVLRVTRVGVRHRRPAIRVVAVLASLWLVLSLLDVRTETGPVASRTGIRLRLRPGEPDPVRAARPARVRPRRRDRPDARRARRQTC